MVHTDVMSNHATDDTGELSAIFLRCSWIQELIENPEDTSWALAEQCYESDNRSLTPWRKLPWKRQRYYGALAIIAHSDLSKRQQLTALQQAWGQATEHRQRLLYMQGIVAQERQLCGPPTAHPSSLQHHLWHPRNAS